MRKIAIWMSTICNLCLFLSKNNIDSSHSLKVFRTWVWIASKKKMKQWKIMFINARSSLINQNKGSRGRYEPYFLSTVCICIAPIYCNFFYYIRSLPLQTFELASVVQQRVLRLQAWPILSVSSYFVDLVPCIYALGKY